MSPSDLSDLSLVDIFRMEAEDKGPRLGELLLQLEKDPGDTTVVDALMRTAHSLKGAARVVNLVEIMELAHAMEDVFSAAGRGEIAIDTTTIDVLLGASDRLLLLGRQATEETVGRPVSDEGREAIQGVRRLLAGGAGQDDPGPGAATVARDGDAPGGTDEVAGGTPTPPSPAPPAADDNPPIAASAPPIPEPSPPAAAPPAALAEQSEQSGQPEKSEKSEKPSRPAGAGGGQAQLKVAADRMSRLVGLAGEAEIAARRLPEVVSHLLVVRRRFTALERTVDQLAGRDASEPLIATLRRQCNQCQELLQQGVDLVERHAMHHTDVAVRLRQEVLATRMLPFGECCRGLERLVRELARELGKKARLVLQGRETPADRDILEQLEACLVQFVRNAMDHGIELPAARREAGKAEEATITVHAFHRGGMLVVEVADDGRGLDLDAIRSRVLERRLATPEVVAELSDREVAEFLFLPGFTTKNEVSQVSGRGVGLDVVQETVRRLRGSVRLDFTPGGGTRFELVLPLTLATSRALLVDIAGEPYAVPIAAIDRVLIRSSEALLEVEGRHYLKEGEERIGLVRADLLLGAAAEAGAVDGSLVVLVFRRDDACYGLLVSAVREIRDLVVQPLDPRLGTVNNINAAAILEDGTPVLILDVDDLARSMEKLIQGHDHRGLKAAGGAEEKEDRPVAQRILVADDSITVREVEKEMLRARGYQVAVAVDGQDAWHMLKENDFDLLVTDIDMPRLDGFSLVERIRADRRLESLPVIIVSYKDRQEDRIRGMEVGADYYLTKGSFDDESLVRAVHELIGPAEEEHARRHRQ